MHDSNAPWRIRSRDSTVRSAASLTLVGLAAMSAGLFAATLGNRGATSPEQTLGLLVAVPAVPLLFAVTVIRFEIVVVALLAVRISLDGLKTGGTTGASLDPAALVGGYLSWPRLPTSPYFSSSERIAQRAPLRKPSMESRLPRC